MTYGWTILVIIIAGGALVYFDVLNPGKFLPDSCNIQGFTCTDFKVESTKAILYLTNNIGDDIVITQITVGPKSATFTDTLQIGDSRTFQVTGGTFGNVGDRFKGDLNITYTTVTSQIGHTNVGEIATTIES